MQYEPTTAIPDNDSEFRAVLLDELRRIADSIRESEPDVITFKEFNAPPEKPTQGMVALADGTNWDPGGGEGLYIRLSGVWTKLN